MGGTCRLAGMTPLRFPRLFRIQTQPAFSADQIKGEQTFPLMKDLWCTYMMGWGYLPIGITWVS